MRTLGLLCLAVFLGGCATPMTEDECRFADWHKIGDRDARYYAVQPQIDQYAAQCARYGMKADEAPYMAGWREGYSETQGRMGSGGGGGGGSM